MTPGGLGTRIAALLLALLAIGASTPASAALAFSALNWALAPRLSESGYGALAAGLLLVLIAGLAMAALTRPLGRWVRARAAGVLALVSMLGFIAALLYEAVGTTFGLLGGADVFPGRLLVGLAAAQGPALAVTATFFNWSHHSEEP